MQNKEEIYALAVKQVKSLIEGEKNIVGIEANISALLKEAFPERFWWVGFYMVHEGKLQLGPFQGPVACYSIGKGKGVCGTAWAEAKTVIVDDVETFPGHIACSSLSRSEIVVPIFSKHTNDVVGVIDIDSKDLGAFDEIDQTYLEEIASIITQTVDL